MKLVELQNVARSICAVSENLGRLAGVTDAYPLTPHFGVLPADFEQLSQENHAKRTWTGQGKLPTHSIKGATYGSGKDQIVVTTYFDCTKE